METKIKVSIAIEVGDKLITVTEEEAKKLYERLSIMFEKPSPVILPVAPSGPFDDFKGPAPQVTYDTSKTTPYNPTEVTCKCEGSGCEKKA